MGNYWFYENHTDGYGVNWKIKKIVHEETTKFQDLAIVDTVEWGKALVLDGMFQTTEKDEFIYHEIITHVVMKTHPNPQKVLIIGGGDGGVLREVLKYDSVIHVDMVEIDDRVVENSKVFFPQIASGFDDFRSNLHTKDGMQFVKNTLNKYDVAIVDSSDPIGPAVGLFSKEFYKDISNCLNDDGLVVVQSESPIFYEDIFKSVHKNMSAIFSNVYVYLATIPTYVSGPWSFTIGSKKYNPENLPNDKNYISGLKYYSESVHKAAFALPPFINQMIR
ncbi:Spermidine synthase [Candidatus Syntrophocurvum alkaliphilum]|uniref:Polyamine aminopropyltransferase n=1 Tax=Candidatus Syntrophocurvum alkaliphilum TaxID=2293317 RepID=A0A6I6DE99_9FIRM|nr:polyamine aminopropyltransferase [Candidatus Syntrophocurvum alkaliphilum]QGT99556.1 Spermidine synthase [Candidatus Syntrophocurvum alkaliphilum]